MSQDVDKREVEGCGLLGRIVWRIPEYICKDGIPEYASIIRVGSVIISRPIEALGRLVVENPLGQPGSKRRNQILEVNWMDCRVDD